MQTKEPFNVGAHLGVDKNSWMSPRNNYKIKKQSQLSIKGAKSRKLRLSKN